jgi:hypothetical protein
MLLLLLLLYFSNDLDDEVMFVDGTGPRVLRGKIREENGWVVVDRRDGQHRIAREKVTKILYRRRR